jgi:TRAP-type mannitol/chloroaromatic compound transport system permease small subunit
MQELVMYFHAMVFLGCAGFVFNKDDHVRVDIYYRDSSKKYKKFINLICGVIFLLPVVIFIAFYSFNLIVMAWSIKEISTEAGGLPFVYIQKSLILLFPLTLALAFCNFILKKPWK